MEHSGVCYRFWRTIAWHSEHTIAQRASVCSMKDTTTWTQLTQRVLHGAISLQWQG